MTDKPDPTTLPDTALLAEYQQCEAEPGDPRYDAIVAEIKRRELDI